MPIKNLSSVNNLSMPDYASIPISEGNQNLPGISRLRNLTEVYWTEKIWVGTVAPRIHCLRRREWWQGDQQTTRGLGGKAFAQLVVGIHATLQRQQTPGQDIQDQGFQGFFSF